MDTPVGTARVHRAAPAGAARATVVLGHGAGGGIGAGDLIELAKALPEMAVTVLLVEQPWRVAGKKVATAPHTLDRAWLAVLTGLAVDGPLLVGGRSAGARVACRTAGELGALGVLALAFPVHPPGRQDRSRLDELDLPAAAGIATLVLQGTRDPFGGPREIPPAPGRTVVPVDGADHSFRALKGATGPRPLSTVVSAVTRWLDDLVP